MRTLFLPPAYQDSAEGCLILRDGFTGFVRLSESSDRDALRECFNPLSSESKRQRFFSIADPAEALLEQQCDSSNPRLQLTLIVSRIVKARPESFATGSYVARDETTGEVAFACGCHYGVRDPGRSPAEACRGHPPADIEAIDHVLLRVLRLVEEDITEHLSPIVVGPRGEGCRIVGSRIRVRLPQKRQAARYTTAALVRSAADASTPVETTIFEGASHDRDH